MRMIRKDDHLSLTSLTLIKNHVHKVADLFLLFSFQVDPDGLSVLAGFEDGVVRQLTVVKRDQNAVATKKDSIKFELKLTQVFKPHVKAVTALAVSKDGKFLATGVRISS